MTKTAIITGACGGIGLNLVQAFRSKNYEVIALDIAKNPFTDPKIHFFHMDLSQAEQIKELFAKLKSQFPKVEVLINNGAISKFNKHILESRAQEFAEVLAVNLQGAYLCSKEFILLNHAADYGRIINIASTRFWQNEANWEAYGASKAGLIALTNTLCVSLAGTKITANAISPGWIATENYHALSQKDHAQHPSGRVGKPSDIASACLFLADEANDFINGANLIIDGGMTKKMIYEE